MMEVFLSASTPCTNEMTLNEDVGACGKELVNGSTGQRLPVAGVSRNYKVYCSLELKIFSFLPFFRTASRQSY